MAPRFHPSTIHMMNQWMLANGWSEYTTLRATPGNGRLWCTLWGWRHAMGMETLKTTMAMKHENLVPRFNLYILHINSLVQDCRNAIANALELLPACTKPSSIRHTLWRIAIMDMMDPMDAGKWMVWVYSLGGTPRKWRTALHSVGMETCHGNGDIENNHGNETWEFSP